LRQKLEEKLPGYQPAHLATSGTLEECTAKSEMSVNKGKWTHDQTKPNQQAQTLFFSEGGGCGVASVPSFSPKLQTDCFLL